MYIYITVCGDHCVSLQLNQPHALYLDTELRQQDGKCGTGEMMLIMQQTAPASLGPGACIA